MSSRVDPAALLAGPRGRRVCWELLTQTGGWERGVPPDSAGPERMAIAIGAAIDRIDVGAVAAASQPGSLLLALADSVTWAMYWQKPDDWDRRLADPRVVEQLWPVAEAVSRAPAAMWWSTPMDAAVQQEVVFDDADGRPQADAPADVRAALQAWRMETLEGERRAAELPDDPRAPYSGHWWSAPVFAGVHGSTRTLESLGPVGLHLVEDAGGWSSARSWSLQLRSDASIFEIAGPDNWAELVRRYPLSVAKSRRHDWWRSTGRDLNWAIPDYYAVATDYDAVHLSVAGYLSTAGRAFPAGEAHTVLAGWDPDQTRWLTHNPQRIDPPARWIATGDPEPFAWARSTQ